MPHGQRAVIVGTAITTVLITVVLVAGYGLDRLPAALGLGLIAGAVLALPLGAVWAVAFLRGRVPFAGEEGRWTDGLVWAVVTLLLWVVVPWWLFAPYWDWLGTVLLAGLPLSLQIVTVSALWLIGARRADATT